ncbi:MAG: hypothetical protein GY859_41025, partial [Desulfobacterales bacterium]|nr:hypothetical protein [Desulfobacterales bacterium]
MNWRPLAPVKAPTFIITLTAMALMILFSPSTGLAASKINIKPFISAGVGYDSNFYRTETDEREVVTYAVMPGVMLGYETGRTLVSLSYTLEAFYYDDVGSVPDGEPSLDDDSYLGHLFIFDAQYQLTSRLTVNLEDAFHYSRDERLSRLDAKTRERRKYWVNYLTPGVFYDYEDKFSLGLRYRWTELEYVDDDGLDYSEDRVIVNLLYHPMRTITLDLEYQYWKGKYKEGSPYGYASYDNNWLMFLVQKRFKYISLEAGIGWQTRDYDSQTLDDGDELIYKAGVTWENPPPPDGRRNLGKVFIRARNHAHLGFESGYSTLGEAYRIDRFILSLDHVIRDRIILRARGIYEMDDYNASTREDDY